MEADRFGLNRNYFIIGMVCLILGIFMFVVSFYSFPFLIFSWRYKMPSLVPMLSGYLQLTYHLESRAAGWLIFLSLFLPSIILFVIADIMSNKIDGQIHKEELENSPQVEEKHLKVGETESKGLVFKIIMIIILVFIASQFFQWAISTSSPM